MKVEELESFITPHAVKILKNSGIEELFPPQKEAVEAGLFSDENFVIAIPTASGKTLLAELAMLKEIMNAGKCLYIVPLRALAVEKYEEFQRWEKIGVKVAYSIGDFESKDEWLGGSDIIITTSEKADSILRNGAGWIKEITCLVVDEIHLLDSGKRGPVLEILIGKFWKLNPDIRILALSATIPNAEEIAEWLKAKLYTSEWRPTKLYEGVYHDGITELFSDGEIEQKKIGKGDIAALTLDCLREGGQVLIFDSTRRNAESTARKISSLTMKFIDSNEEIAKLVLEENEGEMSQKLADCIRLGSAFHHAGLLNSQRRVVEKAFKEGKIKVVVATPTLAAGVNLPARRVIIKSYHRFEPGFGNQPIKVMEYKQMAGRAGRPGLDPRGEAILIAKNKKEKEKVLERFIAGKPENVESKLGAETHLRFHTLSLIAEGFVKSFSEIIEFFSQTFFFHQNKLSPISELNKVIRRLEEWGFIEWIEEAEMIEGFERFEDKAKKNEFGFRTFESLTNGRLVATHLGSLISKLYIDPLTGFIFVDNLYRYDRLSEIAALHLVCHSPDMETLFLRKSDGWVEDEAYELRDELVYFPSAYSVEYELFLAEFKTALCIYDWISEEDEDSICNKYGISPGDLRRIIETGEWLIHSLRRISNFINHPQQSLFMKMESRIKYGIKEDLIDLVKVKGIGRARARKLYLAGIKTRKDILTQKNKLPAIIGKKTAEKIIGEVETEFKAGKADKVET
ncbi:MAG: DEAD/DEAH box helicase [Archaeoglobus sp.]|nr:DEAD/DEAH box helicase [Archaeoglobus sp.]